MMAIVVYMILFHGDCRVYDAKLRRYNVSDVYVFSTSVSGFFRDPQHVTCSRENINHFDLFEKMLKQSIAISKAYKTINVNL